MITLEEIKRQCRVDFDDDDAYLRRLGEVAEEYVVRRTGRGTEELCTMGGGEWPAPLVQAVLVRVAELYANPEGTERPNALLEDLIRPYQKLTV